MNIKEIRESKKIKQVEIANILNLDNAYYSRLEKRGEKMSVEQLKKIATAMNMSIVDFFEPSNSSNDKVQSLEKRILELEEIIIDKNKIIKLLESK